jgi:hypothetical protein
VYVFKWIWYEKSGRTLSLSKDTSAPVAAMHYPKVVSAAKGDRSHTIAGVSLRAQNGDIHPLARSAREGAEGEGR